MSHTDRFDEHVQHRNAERAAQAKVTWRRARDATGDCWSGLGPDGLLVYVRLTARGYEYGRRLGPRTVSSGQRRTLAAGKAAAEALLES